jgi:hypothetical protein
MTRPVAAPVRVARVPAMIGRDAAVPARQGHRVREGAVAAALNVTALGWNVLPVVPSRQREGA